MLVREPRRESRALPPADFVAIDRSGSADSVAAPAHERPEDRVRRGPAFGRFVGGAMTKLTESYWPADRSVPLRDLTVGDALREAADGLARRRRSRGRASRASTGAGPSRRCWPRPSGSPRALLARFSPGERVAVWAPNLPGVGVARVRRRARGRRARHGQSRVPASRAGVRARSVGSGRRGAGGRVARQPDAGLARRGARRPRAAARGRHVRRVGRVPRVGRSHGVCPMSTPTIRRRSSTRRARPASRRARCSATAH